MGFKSTEGKMEGEIVGKLVGPTDGVILLGSFEGEMVGYDPE